MLAGVYGKKQGCEYCGRREKRNDTANARLSGCATQHCGKKTKTKLYCRQLPLWAARGGDFANRVFRLDAYSNWLPFIFHISGRSGLRRVKERKSAFWQSLQCLVFEDPWGWGKLPSLKGWRSGRPQSQRLLTWFAPHITRH